MKNIIVGTAGHIDHGKTALIRALTGIDTDRLEEEKRRGISIDIGFAHLDLPPALRIGFVDVPGHERFIKNMLAGAGGIDMVLLVIAADESIKPQTREHFDICRLLGIRKGIVVLTKADLVDPDLLDLARLEAEEFVAGSFLEGAPTIAVSSVTRAGFDELKAALCEIGSSIPAKDPSRHFRLPVDRSFSMRGFGTVATGTLVSGTVQREAEIEAQPGGKRMRVRGIQVHGGAVHQATAGQRTALNLAGAEPEDLRRGMVLVEPGVFEATDRIDCEIELLPSAKPLKNHAPVHFHTGTAELEAEVRLLDGVEALQPGASACARLVLSEPVLTLPGDRFIIRMFSPVVTIGGGVVIDLGRHRYRKTESAAERLEILAHGSVEDRLTLLAGESKFGLGVHDVIARTGLLVNEVEEAVTTSSKLTFFPAPHSWIAGREWFRATLTRLTNLVRAFHRQNPLLPGIPKQELRSRELPGAPAFLMDALLAKSSDLVSENEIIRLKTHKLVLQQDEENAAAAILKAFQEAGLAVPSVAGVLGKSGVDPGRARSLLQMLLRERRLLKVGEDLVFHPGAIEALRGKLAERKGQRLSVPQFKDIAGVSRKYAIPLLEYLDRERVTRRDGEDRIVL